ncbi:hypothetical protein, partial [Clostridium fessum]|uniref:hypothetical protein n=1 Tax=Clostridium fessum TaxID=2126740 RepID=UPI0032C0FF4D
VCAFTALTVRKHGPAGKNPIAVGNFKWIFARDCEGTEQLRIYCSCHYTKSQTYIKREPLFPHRKQLSGHVHNRYIK